MNKDDIQQSKALIKLKNIKRTINLLQELNLSENENNMKEYNIVLDYNKDVNDEFTTFIVKVIAEGYNNNSMRIDKTLYDFNFKLMDEDTGFAIFKEIREYFVKKNNLQYPSFVRDEGYNKKRDTKYTSYQIKTNHHVTLVSMIHSKKDEEKLEKLNDRIFEKYGTYIRKIHIVNSQKDEIQIFKAEKKRELAFITIDMLNELNEISDNFKKTYDIIIDHEKLNDSYKFKIKISKNNKTIPLNINFKLKDKRSGIELLNDIVKYYLQNYDIILNNYEISKSDNTLDYVIIGTNNVNINYKIPMEFGEEAISQFKNTINNRKDIKTLKKTM
ncbi:MAG: hypothetical protein E7166_02885 [Firmicutes bacterium]|nr:hypothetical protein [Bacillota bacterium]